MNHTKMYARSFAIIKHKDQMYGNFPYIIHLQDVYLKSKKYDLSIEEQHAAYLHDTLEDTTTTIEELISYFGHDVATLVYCVTAVGKNRKEKTLSVIEKLKNNNKAVNLKLIDRISNIETSIQFKNINKLNMYLKENELYLEIFQKAKLQIFQDYLLVLERAKKIVNAKKLTS